MAIISRRPPVDNGGITAASYTPFSGYGSVSLLAYRHYRDFSLVYTYMYTMSMYLCTTRGVYLLCELYVVKLKVKVKVSCRHRFKKVNAN